MDLKNKDMSNALNISEKKLDSINKSYEKLKQQYDNLDQEFLIKMNDYNKEINQLKEENKLITSINLELEKKVNQLSEDLTNK